MAKPGDPILDVYTSAWYNKVDRYVNKHKVGIPGVQNKFQQSWIWVENHEAVAKEQFTVVALDEPALLVSDRLDNITNEMIWTTKDLDGDEPDNIFILLDPLPGEIGAQARALVSGVTLLKVTAEIGTRTLGDIYQYIDLFGLISAPSGRIQVVDIFLENPGVYNYYLVVVGPIVNAEGNVARFVLTSDPTGGSTGSSGDYMTAYADFYDDTLSFIESTELYLNYDIFSGFVTGSSGEAAKNDKGYWIAVNRKAASDLVWVKFTLTTDLSSTGTATINTTSDSTNWPTSTSITVTNYSGYFAYTGAIGIAVLIASTWYVVEVDRTTPIIEATVSANSHDWSSGDSARGFTVDATNPVTYSSATGLGTFPVSFTYGSLTITNPNNLHFLSGDKVIARQQSYDVYYIIKVLRQKCMRFRFVLTANAPAGATPNLTATAICPVGEDSGPPPSGSLTIKDIYGRAHNAKSGHKGIACYDFNNDWYFVEDIQHISTRFIGTLQATLSGSAATISVTPVTALNGVLPSGTQTVKNTYSWADGTTGHKILVEWNPIDGQWETNQMRCPS